MMEGNTQETKFRVAVIGAGIAGCCLTIGLSQNPLLDVHLYEAYSSIGVRGAGLALHGNAIKAMEIVSPEIKKTYFKKSHFMANEEEMEMATQIIVGSGSHTGTLVAELGRAKGRRTVHRAHLIQGLIEDVIPRNCVHFNKRMVGIKQDTNIDGSISKVIVTFSDKMMEEFDLVFGSEGVKSPTRKFILGLDHPAAEPVNHDNWRCFNALVPMEAAKKVLHRESIEKVRMFCTPIGYINGLPVDLGQTYSISCYQRDSKRPGRERIDFGAEEWNGFCDEITSLISLLEKDMREDWKVRDHDHAPTYYSGHVAMIGDAAHATGPHAGNGAAQAIEDAAILSRVFAHVESKCQIDAALRAFDEIRRPRSQRVVDITRQFGRLYSQDEEVRDLESMKRQLREGGMYTNGVDMDAQIRAAVSAFRRAEACT
ncbi:FAD/NAD(P)-binding domain-containing protein [Hypomontagnella submonticulosa]|nr:FAD/NAD(P)-binding domain-containing protein [Hypomontagnella submonticulosa]